MGITLSMWHAFLHRQVKYPWSRAHTCVEQVQCCHLCQVRLLPSVQVGQWQQWVSCCDWGAQVAMDRPSRLSLLLLASLAALLTGVGCTQSRWSVRFDASAQVRTRHRALILPPTDKQSGNVHMFKCLFFTLLQTFISSDMDISSLQC